MGRRLNAEIWEKIVLNRALGKSQERIASELGVAATSVTATLLAVDAVRNEDWAKCCNIITTYDMAIDVFKWAAEMLGKEIPEVIEQAYTRWKEERRANRAKGKAEEEKKPEEAPTPAIPAADHWEEEKALLTTLCMELKRNNELMEQLYDVVFPKWAGDVKDNFNVNCDLINQSLKRVEDKLERITINTRRKGM